MGVSKQQLNLLDDDGQIINYYYPYNRMTIEAQRKQREPSKNIINHNIDFDSDIPF